MKFRYVFVLLALGLGLWGFPVIAGNIDQQDDQPQPVQNNETVSNPSSGPSSGKEWVVQLAMAVKAMEAGDYKTAANLIQPFVDQGNVQAISLMGSMYADGQGVPQDYNQALKYYQMAADQGLAEAQFNLGGMYAQGRGVAPDIAQAIKYYGLAADQGMTDAQVNLGVMYVLGGNISQDYVQAYKWFSLAATKGDPQAIKAVDGVSQRMTADQVSQAQQLVRDWRPVRSK